MPMWTRTWLAVSAALLALPAAAAEIEGVRFAEVRQVAGVDLRLHGVGLLRHRMVVKAYVAALYLAAGARPEQALADVPRRLEIEYFWPIEAEDFGPATLEGIARNVDAETLDRLRARIERMSRAYEDVERGDRYSLSYVPGVGTELARNDEPLCLIEGADFAAAIFSIWLGAAPLDRSLKAQLLGSS